MVGEEQKEEKEGLSPWVQHSTVISIPRFDYKAPSSLIDHSHCGFLITCTIKREKSATKEAISILEKYVGSLTSDGFERLEPADANVTAKRRKICSEEIDGEGVKIAESKEVANVLGTSGEVAKETPSAKTDADLEIGSVLSLVKLTRSGLLLFTFSRNNYQHTVDILSNIFHSLGSGSLKPPLWCHRILPIQATCSLKEKDLHDAISKLVREYLDDERNKHERPIRFAVGYNRRGIDETEMKIQKNNPKDSDELTLLDRNKCFSVVAGAVKDVAADSVVDLKSPETKEIRSLLCLLNCSPFLGYPMDCQSLHSRFFRTTSSPSSLGSVLNHWFQIVKLQKEGIKNGNKMIDVLRPFLTRFNPGECITRLQWQQI